MSRRKFRCTSADNKLAKAVTAKAGCRAGLIIGLCASSSSLAANEREPIRLTYVADAGCPSAKEFEASVLERTSRARPAGKREIAREYRVVVRRMEGKSVARLEFAAAGGGTVTREVAADECVEAVRAIALVTALAFDAVAAAAAGASGQEKSQDVHPAAEQSGAEAGAVSPPVEPVTRPKAPTSPAANAKPGADAAVRKREVPARRDAPVDSARDVKPIGSSSARSAKPQFGLGARATLTSTKAPGLLPGAEVFALLADPRLKWLIQLGVAGERGARLESGPGEAQFSFVGGRLEGCFFGISLGKAIALMPCAVFEGGALIAEGYIEQPRTVVDPWFALGLNARLSADLGRATALLEAGPSFPLRPDDRVVFGNVEHPRQEVHNVDWIGGFVSLGLSFAVE